MEQYFSIYLYFALVAALTLLITLVSALMPSIKDSPAKFLPYESGISSKTDLMHKRFPMRHYLVALLFLVFDIEVIFMYPWAVVAKEIGAFAFYEMGFFVAALFVGFAYAWKKRGLEWD